MEEEEDDMDFVVEELADTDEEDDDEPSEEASDSGSDLAYEPESKSARSEALRRSPHSGALRLEPMRHRERRLL
jgi:hypothetical protein